MQLGPSLYMTTFHAVKNIIFEGGGEKKNWSSFLQIKAWEGNQIARGEQTRQRGSLRMSKFLDLFLAISNHSCLAYISAANSICSDAELSDHPRQKWVMSGEKKRNHYFLSHSRTPIPPLQACRLTGHLSKWKTKPQQQKTCWNTSSWWVLPQNLVPFLLCSSSQECLKHSLSTVHCYNTQGQETRAWLSSWCSSLTRDNSIYLRKSKITTSQPHMHKC